MWLGNCWVEESDFSLAVDEIASDANANKDKTGMRRRSCLIEEDGVRPRDCGFVCRAFDLR